MFFPAGLLQIGPPPLTYFLLIFDRRSFKKLGFRINKRVKS